MSICAAADAGHNFARHMFTIMEGRRPNPNELLVAASSFLDTAQGEGTAGLEIARRMAFRALDWAVFERPDDYDRLLRAIHLFRMHAELTNH